MMSTDNVSSRTRSKSRHRRRQSSDVPPSSDAASGNVQTAEQIATGEGEEPLDDIEEWSDASGGDSEDRCMDDCNGTGDENDIGSTGDDIQQNMLQSIVQLITPLGEKMDVVRQEVSDMKVSLRMEFQEEIQKMKDQIKAVNDRMDAADRVLRTRPASTDNTLQPQSLSVEAPPFVPMETPTPMLVQEQMRCPQRMPRYDGTAVWEAYLAQFNILSQGNSWSDEQKAFFLSTSLEGKALTVLANMAAPDRSSFAKLVAALESRFGARHQQQQSRMLLSTKKRQDEPLQEFVETLKRRVMLAYPYASGDIQDALALHHLTTAVEEPIRTELLRQKPKTLQEALEIVATEEAIMKCCGTPHRTAVTAPVRAIRDRDVFPEQDSGVSEGGVSELTGIVREVKGVLQLLKQHLPQNDNRGGDGAYRFSGSCWYCQKQGHMKRDCRTWKADMQKGTRPSQAEQKNTGN